MHAIDQIRQTYDLVIGLEVHCQLLCDEKLFCNCSWRAPHVRANENTCPICMVTLECFRALMNGLLHKL